MWEGWTGHAFQGLSWGDQPQPHRSSLQINWWSPLPNDQLQQIIGLMYMQLHVFVKTNIIIIIKWLTKI